MRVSDRTTSRNYLNNLNKSKNDFLKTSNQITTGLRVGSMSEDVSAGTRTLRLRMSMHKDEMFYSNVNAINDELSAVEDQMMDINDLLTDLHEIGVKAQNEVYTQDDLNILATEVDNIKEQILQILNYSYGERYAFGGSNASGTAPFAFDEDGNVTYQGYNVDEISKNDDGDYIHTDPETGEVNVIKMENEVYFDVGLGITMQDSQVDSTSAFKISYSGLDFFGFGVDEDGKSNNILNQVADFAAAIREGDSTVIGSWDDKISKSQLSFRANITELGSKTKFLENTLTRLQKSIDTAKVRIDDLIGTQMEDAIIELTLNETTLTALQNLASRVLPSSLMSFIR